MVIWKRLFLICFAIAVSSAFGRDAAQSWVEVRSPNFAVLTDSSEKQARHIAGQLERMRAVFRANFPKASSGNDMPIEVIALRDRRGFQALAPESSLAKGQLPLAGLFLRAPDKNYILLRLDAEGEHPYATVYHEYTHFLLSGAQAWLPLWLNEGLAEYYQNTEIHDKDVAIGSPSTDNILLLRDSNLLPIATLLAVDAKSPYYHEEQKGYIFYAESWALTHMLVTSDGASHAHRLPDYVELVSQGADPVAAGQRAFGDLGQLQKALSSYISQQAFRYSREPITIAADESAYKAAAVPQAAADAERADFLAYNGREKDARALLAKVLSEDEKNASARETMGYLEFRDGNTEAARKWYEQAVRLDSQSYLAHYYYAAISMRGSSVPVKPEEIEASFRAAIRLNPAFAPAYDGLAGFYAMHHEKLDEAHIINLTAVQLDPSNMQYRMNAASVLLEGDRYKDALAVLRNAEKLAKTPEETAALESRIKELEHYEAERERRDEAAKNPPSQPAEASDVATVAAPKHPTEAPRGPKLVAKGVIKGVECSYPSSIELRVENAGKRVALYSNNYYKIDYSAANYAPEGEIHPCSDLEGMKASIQYAATSDKTVDGQILSVQLSK